MRVSIGGVSGVSEEREGTLHATITAINTHDKESSIEPLMAVQNMFLTSRLPNRLLVEEIMLYLKAKLCQVLSSEGSITYNEVCDLLDTIDEHIIPSIERYIRYLMSLPKLTSSNVSVIRLEMCSMLFGFCRMEYFMNNLYFKDQSIRTAILEILDSIIARIKGLKS